MSYKLFSHRGLLIGNSKLKENTIKAFQNSIDNHFKAIEVDIWYYQNELILHHDQPIKKIDNYDKLSDLFKEFGNKIEYWLDLKNLKQKNATTALNKLKLLIDKNKIDYDKILFVPCLKKTNLKQNEFAYKEVRNIFGKDCNLAAFTTNINKNNLQKYYHQLKDYNINKLSIKFSNIDEEFIKIFYDIEIFAWTVDNKKTLDYLTKLNIKNFATNILTY